ncbi:hypothetical protein AQUCO_04000132v1 [Aquilegia coerulea]|uniref:Uncharacterized protein n=1 Tax=Aquilegia coerulea TaxID=218851 RepID=A0A2G5CRE5_AQUCA|nr:hypothetical protein AQUCO_04000132v1 [Aquilegia coerulea]
MLKVSVLIDERKDEWVAMLEIPFGVPKGLRPANCEFLLCGLWMNEDLFCTEGKDLLTENAYEVRCYSYKLIDEAFNSIRLPFAKDVSGDDISPQLVISHVGSLVSPHKVMADAKQKPFIPCH